MVFVYVILGIIVYLGIGGIVMGYQDTAGTHGIIMNDDWALFYLFLWPLYLLYVGFVFFLQLPCDFGGWLYKKFKRR